MEYILLDLGQDISEEQLLDAINNNHTTAMMMEKEITQIIKNNNVKNENKEIELIEEEIVTDDINLYQTDENQDFEDEIEYYFSMINSLGNSKTLKDDIEDALPSRKNPHYVDIIMRLKAELLKQIKDIDELLIENYDTIDTGDLTEFKDEINKIEQIMNLISEVVLDDEKLDGQHEKDNKLIFVPTSGGNIRVLEEIDRIDQEFYENFTELFDSIKDGSFKNVKRFGSTNSKSAKVSEVKGFKTRVVFDRIGKGEYAIITAFIKKSDNDNGYLEALELRIKNYMCQKDYLKEQLENKDFISENQRYEEELYQKLNTQKAKEYKREMNQSDK